MAYDIFKNYGFEDGFNKTSYENALSEADEIMELLRTEWPNTINTPMEYLISKGFDIEDSTDLVVTKEVGNNTIVFDFTGFTWDKSKPVIYYVLGSEGRIPAGYTRTLATIDIPQTDWTSEGCDGDTCSGKAGMTYLNNGFDNIYGCNNCDDNQSLKYR